jgi:hypothetical protein
VLRRKLHLESEPESRYNDSNNREEEEELFLEESEDITMKRRRNNSKKEFENCVGAEEYIFKMSEAR